MGKRIYIETSIISYLTARPSRNVLAAAWQYVTQEWWDKQRERFELFISELVVAENLVKEGAIPRHAMDDALHVALASVHSIDYLLTWNCRHLDNAEKKPIIRRVCTAAGYRCPEICTPYELMGEPEND